MWGLVPLSGLAWSLEAKLLAILANGELLVIYTIINVSLGKMEVFNRVFKIFSNFFSLQAS